MPLRLDPTPQPCGLDKSVLMETKQEFLYSQDDPACTASSGVSSINAVLQLDEGLLFVSMRVLDVRKRSNVLLAVDQTASGVQETRSS